MIFDNSLTVYHKTNTGFLRQFFLRACVFSEDKISHTSGVEREKSELTIRIFSTKDEDIASGDKVYLGYCPSPTPPPGSHTILGVTKNQKGSNRTKHYKIIAI